MSEKRRRPGCCHLGGYQFARIEGKFRKYEVALAHIYEHADSEPVRLYWQEARKFALWLNRFADWGEAMEKDINRK